jgi:hypothetical protein
MAEKEVYVKSEGFDFLYHEVKKLIFGSLRFAPLCLRSNRQTTRPFPQPEKYRTVFRHVTSYNLAEIRTFRRTGIFCGSTLSTLRMKAQSLTVTQANFYLTAQHYNPESSNHQ